MKIGDTVRIRKTDITGEITDTIGGGRAFLVKVPQFAIPVMCYIDEIESFRRDDTLIGCIAQSCAEANK